MARATLKLTGVFEAWAPFVRQGRLERANGSEALVLVRVLEGAATPEALATLRDDGRLLARVQHEHVLRVEQTSGVGGHLALVHENFDCVSMSHVIAALKARGQVLPSRVAVEIAAAVGIAIEECWKINDGERRLIHPGPSPGEVLLDTAGRVKLAGIAVVHPGEPWPAAPTGYSAPEGPGGWQAATWMVGALLVELLTGESPQEGSTNAASHEAMLRRVVLKLLSRPGDTPGELLVQAIRQALAHDVDARGTPGAYGRMLRDLAVQLPTPGLRAWAPGTVPAVQKRAGGRAPGAGRTLTPAPSPEAPPPPMLTPRRESPLPIATEGDLPTSEDPDPTMMGMPLPRELIREPKPAPGPRIAPVEATLAAPTPAAANETRPVPTPSVAPTPRPGPSPNRPAPQRVAAPAVGSGGVADRSGPALGPSLLAGAPPAPLVNLPDSDDEAEMTVIGQPLERPEPPPSPRIDPVFSAFPPSESGGPAPRAVPRRSVVEEEVTSSKKSRVPMILGIVTVGLVLGSALMIGMIGMYFYGNDAPVAEPVPTLADVVGQPVVEPVPTEPAPTDPAPPAEKPAPSKPAPEAPKPAPEPAKPAPTPAKAPEPAKPAPEPVKAAPAKVEPTKAAPAPAAKAEEEPVRISARPPAATTAPPAPVPAPAPAAVPAPAAEVTGPFRVTFTAAEPGYSLEVKCMQGGGTGSSVVVEDAVKGNCRVVGKSDTATVMALVTLAGPRTYLCFAGGSRSCK